LLDVPVHTAVGNFAEAKPVVQRLRAFGFSTATVTDLPATRACAHTHSKSAVPRPR
jgi:hypothetical protein